MHTGTIAITYIEGEPLQIGAADPLVSISFGLALQLAADGHLRMRDGQLVLTGVDPDGTPIEVRYAITGAWVATEHPAANEAGFLHCERKGLTHVEPAEAAHPRPVRASTVDR